MSDILPRALAGLPPEIYGMSHWLQLTTRSFWENWSQWFRWIRLITGYYLHGWHLLILSGDSESCGRMGRWQWYYYTDQLQLHHQTSNIHFRLCQSGNLQSSSPLIMLARTVRAAPGQHVNIPAIVPVFYVMSADSKAYWEMKRGVRCEVTQYKECYQSQYNLPLPPSITIWRKFITGAQWSFLSISTPPSPQSSSLTVGSLAGWLAG